MKKITSLILAIMMIVTMAPVGIFADDTANASQTETTTTTTTQTVEDSASSDIVSENADASSETSDNIEVSTDEQDNTVSSETSIVPSATTLDSSSEQTDNNSDVSSQQSTESQSEVSSDTTSTTASQQITGSATYEGVTVYVNAPEGAFPSGTTLTINPVSSAAVNSAVENAIDSDKELNGTVAFDITFNDGSGNEIQPAEGYTVSVTFSIAQNSDVVKNNTEDVQVFHLEDSGSSATAVSGAVNIDTSTDNVVSVDAESFSIYAVGTSSPKTLTYNFYDKDGIIISGDTQIVKGGEILSEPVVPEVEGYVFSGWYTA
jgi:hypothetical protein